MAHRWFEDSQERESERMLWALAIQFSIAAIQISGFILLANLLVGAG